MSLLAAALKSMSRSEESITVLQQCLAKSMEINSLYDVAMMRTTLSFALAEAGVTKPPELVFIQNNKKPIYAKTYTKISSL